MMKCLNPDMDRKEIAKFYEYALPDFRESRTLCSDWYVVPLSSASPRGFRHAFARNSFLMPFPSHM